MVTNPKEATRRPNQEERYILEKEIEYLKHLQEHSMFNYNVKFNGFFFISSIITTVILSIIILIVALYNVPYFNQTFSANTLLTVVSLLIILLALIILFFYSLIEVDITEIKKVFVKYQKKIKKKYEEMGLSIDFLNL